MINQATRLNILTIIVKKICEIMSILSKEIVISVTKKHYEKENCNNDLGDNGDEDKNIDHEIALGNSNDRGNH